MMRSGPIPLLVHGLLEYMAAVALMAAPFVFDFRSDAATWLSIGAGVLVLAVAATTDGPTGLVGSLSLRTHMLVDYAVAIALIAMPFVAGFSDEHAPTAWFAGFGLGSLLVTLATRFTEDDGPHDGIGALARGTSVDIEAGRHTVLDD